MKIQYGIAFERRSLEIPPVVTIRWACKRCQANGIAELGSIESATHSGPVVELAQRVAHVHMEASPDCKANIHIALSGFNIKDTEKKG